MKKFANNVNYFTEKNKRNNKLLFKENELPQKNSKKIAIDNVADENGIKISSSKQRLDFNLVKDHIASYVWIWSLSRVLIVMFTQIKNNRDYTFISTDGEWLS